MGVAMLQSTCFTQPTVYLFCSQEIQFRKSKESMLLGAGVRAGVMEGVAMAASCGHHLSNQRIVDAFRAHYDDLVDATTVCTEKVARVLYQKEVIALETMKDASEVGVGKFRRSVLVVDAVFAFIKSQKSLPKSLEVLYILEKHPSLNGVITTIRKQASVTHASRNTSSDRSGECVHCQFV